MESVNEGGNDGAYILGIAYDDRLGVEKDRNSACLLYQIAVATSKWCREDAEKELTSYKVDHVKPVTYLDFYPNLKYNGNVFGPEDMQRAVFNGIDFNLSFDQWHLIEYAFKDYLDKHQNDFFEIEDLCKNVVNRSQHCSTGLSIDQMNNILDIMIDFAVCTGGIIDEDKEYVYWNNETDMLDYKLFSPLTALYSSDDQSSFISIISQIIKDKKNSSVV